jgi:hypothetical protein
MEQNPAENHRRAVARRLFEALCALYPNFIDLPDVVASADGDCIHAVRKSSDSVTESTICAAARHGAKSERANRRR